MKEEFSRHTNQQHRWTEALLAKLRDNLFRTIHFKLTHDEHLKRRQAIYEEEKRLTEQSAAYVRGFMRCAEEPLIRKRFHVRRIIGRPETASAAKWDGMTEELRQACRDHRTESCLAWDKHGEKLFSDWAKE